MKRAGSEPRKHMTTSRSNRAIRLVHALFALFACAIVLALSFIAPLVQFKLKRPFVVISAALFIISLLACLGVAYCLRSFPDVEVRDERESERSFFINTGIASLFLLVIQALIVRGAWFTTGWDPWRLLGGGTSDQLFWYFSEYPNQLFLAGLFRIISSIGARIGLDNGYLCATAVGCICVNCGCFLSGCVANKLSGNRAGYLCFIALALIAGLSPWILVPYSDTYGFFFVSLAIFSIICHGTSIFGVFFFILSSLIGYCIKPTIVFLPASFLFIKLLSFITGCIQDKRDKHSASSWKKIDMRRLLSIVASAGLAVALGLSAKTAVSLPSNDYDLEGSFSAVHYLMMGFNPDTQGIFNGEDVGYSHSFATREERTDANWTVWKERVDAAGPLGVAKLFLRKVLCTYADGTFAWEQEGHFYVDTKGDSELIKSFYGVDDAANEETIVPREPVFAFIAQLLWYTALLGISLNLLNSNPSQDECSLSLSLIMLTAFLVLFECKARYLFLFLPVFFVLAIMGWRSFVQLLSSHDGNRLPQNA